MSRESFNREVRQLVGLQLRRVRYYESQGTWPSWHTYSDFDSVEQGLDLVGDDASYSITWDATFWSYGLRVRPVPLIHFLYAGQFSDVSEDSRWSGFLGQRITDARFVWEPVPSSVAEVDAVYPQHVVLTFEAGGHVYLSAAKPQGAQAPLFEMSDHLAVLFKRELARSYLPSME